MTDDDFGFAPPPFEPQAAMAALSRQLRDLRLTERAGRFEWQGKPLVALTPTDAAIEPQWVAPAARVPEWARRPMRQASDVRRFVEELKRHLAQARTDD
jgi:hypothetical protein